MQFDFTVFGSRNPRTIMKAGDNSEYDCAVNDEQVKKVAKHSNTKTVERLLKRSIKVSISESHSLANWNSTSDNCEAVAEITDCSNTTKSCNEQNTSMQKNEPDQDCDLQNTELDGTTVQDISTQEHFESLDISQVSDFWDQVQLARPLNNALSFYFRRLI